MNPESIEIKKKYSVKIVQSKDQAELSGSFSKTPENALNSESLSPIRVLNHSSSNPNIQNLFSSLTYRSSSPAYSIPKSPKMKSPSVTPGPGDYNFPELPKGPVHSFEKSLKKEDKIESSPGPADYNTEVFSHTYSSILIGKPKSDNKPVSPGPADYNTEIRSFSPAYSIGNSSKEIKREITPGPSDYYLGDQNKSPSCTIGNAKRILIGSEINSKEITPGPSDYQTIIKKHIPAAYLIGKPQEKVKNLPGPADYFVDKVKNYQNSPSYSLGKSVRFEPIKKNYPGPADYQITLRSNSCSHTFARAERKSKLNSDSPGPSFIPKSSLDNRGGVISQRFKEKINVSPGPGAYSSRDLSRSQSFTISKSLKFAKLVTSPLSPVSYNVDLKNSSPRYTFSKSLRTPLFNAEGSCPSTVKNSSFESRNSGIKRIDLTPGPGAYDPVKRNHSPSFTFSKSSREYKIEEKPGPGEYFNDKKLAQVTSEKWAELEKIKNNNTPNKICQNKEDSESPPKIRSNNYFRIKRDKDLTLN